MLLHSRIILIVGPDDSVVTASYDNVVALLQFILLYLPPSSPPHPFRSSESTKLSSLFCTHLGMKISKYLPAYLDIFGIRDF